MSASCDRLARRLPVLVDDPEGLDEADRRHVDTCLRCQATVAQYRRLRRTVQGLDPGRPGPPVVDTVLAALDARSERRKRAVRGVALGLATVTAVGLGAAAVAARRRSA